MSKTTNEDVIVLIKARPELAKKWVEMTAEDIERNSKFRMTNANKKSPFTKACWLLYLYQKTQAHFDNEKNVKDMIRVIKTAMEVLK